MSESQQILETLGPILREALAERDKRIAILERRLSEIESRPIIRDAGVFSTKHSYRPGDGVTFQGSFWLCQRECSGTKPGTNGTWRLAVKRGRDATSFQKAKMKASTAPLPISNFKSGSTRGFQ